MQITIEELLGVVDVAGTTLPVSSQLKSLGVIIDCHMCTALTAT